MEKQIYLTSEQLNTLTVIMSKEISALRQMNSKNMWEKPIEYCRQIEQSPMAVHSVILNTKENDIGYFLNSSCNPKKYEVTMMLVYILLYYRHNNDQLYCTIVLPALREHIKYYNDKTFDTVHGKINEIKKNEELIMKVLQEQQNKQKPKFYLESLGKAQSDRLFEEYNKEQLFRSLRPGIEYLCRNSSYVIDFAETWYNAKATVKKLWQVSYPESYIRRILCDQDTQLGYSCSVRPQYVMLCVYAMMRSVKKSDHFKAAIKEIEGFYNPRNYADYSILSQNMGEWKKVFDIKDVFDDYDYVGEEPEQVQFGKADIEQLQKGFLGELAKVREQLAAKEQEVVSLRDQLEQLKAEKSKPKEEAENNDALPTLEQLHNKVRYELLLRLLEKAGLDLDDTGNKTRFGSFAKALMYCSATESRRYCSTRKYNNTHTREEIKKLNDMLEAMGINDVRL